MEPLASLLIRSGVILLAAELLRRGLRGSPAARRHGIVLFALALLINWPLFAALLPAIPVTWPVSWSATANQALGVVSVTQTFRPIEGGGPSRFAWWPVAIWACGALITAAPFFVGLLRLRDMVRRSRPLRHQPLSNLVDRLCRDLRIAQTPEVLLLPGPVMPMTYGLLKTRVILPDAALTWASSRLRAVLLHELAHVKRRDVASQLLAQLATALWWFQPMAWIGRRSLRRESERACDELVLRHGVPASEYAAELLQIAKSFGAGERCAAGIPMATQPKCGDLEDRLHNILSSRQSGKGPALFRFSAALSCLSVLAMASSAVTFFPQPETTGIRSSTMTLSSLRSTVLSGLLASAGLSAASIGGALLDPSGAPVADAKASIYSPETSLKKEATTTADGKFTFESLPAGQYILRVEKPGFPTLYREFKVLDNSIVDHGLTLGDNSKPAESHPPDQIRIDGSVQQAKLIHKVTPVYPVSAKQARIQGVVQLEMVISKEGVPQDIRVITSPSDDLSQSALEAVAQWRYETTLLNGNPISVITDVTVHYTLSK
jgi:TonB family protein